MATLENSLYWRELRIIDTKITGAVEKNAAI
jgi:uncharacterized membrane protein